MSAYSSRKPSICSAHKADTRKQHRCVRATHIPTPLSSTALQSLFNVVLALRLNKESFLFLYMLYVVYLLCKAGFSLVSVEQPTEHMYAKAVSQHKLGLSKDRSTPDMFTDNLYICFQARVFLEMQFLEVLLRVYINNITLSMYSRAKCFSNSVHVY